MQTENVMIEGPAGLLQGLLEDPAPQFQQSPPIVAVLCHPHPQQGGDMNHKIMYTLSRALQAFNVPVLRFNYRGVGESDGEYDEAIGETDDAIAAMEWMHQRYPNAELWLGGFSFGGAVAMRAAHAMPIKQLITVAPPVAYFQRISLTLPTCPWLVIQGKDDEHIDGKAVYHFVERVAPPVVFESFDGVGHFFHRKQSLITNAIKDYLIGQGY